MKTISIINHKGGVGKTTSVINIGAALAKKNKKVLLIDMDPQANLTESYGIKEKKQTIYEAFKNPENGLKTINIKKNIDLVPGTILFANIELEISQRIARETILKELLKEKFDYDYCIIDSPPSLGLITVNVIVASDEIYIPMVAEYLAYKGIDSIVGIIKQVKKYYNPDVEIKGVFFTQYKENLIMTKTINRLLEEQIGETLMKTRIRVNIELSEAQANGTDIFDYNKNSKGAEDYKKLVNEILKR